MDCRHRCDCKTHHVLKRGRVFQICLLYTSIPDLGRIADWIVRHYGVFLIVFLVVLGPAIYGYTHTDVYYDLAGTLPKSLSSITANDKLNEDFEMGATHIIIADSSLSAKDASAMLDEISKVDGVKMALGFDSLVGPGIPRDVYKRQVQQSRQESSRN